MDIKKKEYYTIEDIERYLFENYNCKKYNKLADARLDMEKNKGIKLTLIICCISIVILIISNVFIYLHFFSFNSTEDLFDATIMKCVEVKVTNDEETWGYATGCFIDSNGMILTNKHVVYNEATNTNYTIVKVRLADEEVWIDAEILNISEDHDLATIKIDKKNTNYFKIETDLQNGETIYTIGNPNGFGLSFTSGVISSKLRNVIYNNTTRQAVQTSLVINEGNSGGPVFDKNGDLVGIISFRLKDQSGEVIQGVSFAVPISNILEFLKKDSE